MTPGGDLYASVTLPVADRRHGRRRHRPGHRARVPGDARLRRRAGGAPKFAEIVAATLLAGELSMGGAIASGEFVDAHETYGRNRPASPVGGRSGMKRPFARVLAAGAPDRLYDAVIIGAGIGGLITANLLAREGLKVLLVEQHYMVGGYCSTFRRAGYTFDAATHFYPLLGNPETLTGRLLAELGVTTGWVKMDPVDTFHFPDGTTLRRAGRFRHLSRRGSRPSSPPRPSRSTRSSPPCARSISSGCCTTSAAGPRRRGWSALPDAHRPPGARPRFRDPKLKLLLTADCPHWGSPPGAHLVRLRLHAAALLLPRQLLSARGLAGLRGRAGAALRGAGRASLLNATARRIVIERRRRPRRRVRGLARADPRGRHARVGWSA